MDLTALSKKVKAADSNELFQSQTKQKPKNKEK